jgi:predicted Holliday junction resolvase-like endonuclease
VLNLSMLDGVNTLFKTSQYDDTDTITQIAGKVASNYVTSYVPSLIGAITRTFADDTRRATYVESGNGKGIPGTFRYAWEQTENKLPGLSRTNIPVRDVFGNPETSSFAERLIENFISPGYISNYKNDPILKEMDRLYCANVKNSEDMIPKDPPKTVKYNNHQYKLTAEQWDRYKELRGQTAHSMLMKLINSTDYKRADPATQVQMIKKCWDYADQVGKKEIIPDYDMENVTSVADITREGKITSYNTKMMTSLEMGDVVGYETMVEALHEQGVEDQKIKEKIANKYRDKYKEAYRKNQQNVMAQIEEILDMTDFNFDLEGWEEQVDEKYGNSGSIPQPIGYVADNGMSDSYSMTRTNLMPSRPSSDSGWDQYMDSLDEYWADYDFSNNDPVGRYG